MPPKKRTALSPLAQIRKESNPPWAPASKKLIEMAHDFSRLWWELWEYHDEARWILEGEAEAVCEEIGQLRSLLDRDTDDELDPDDESTEDVEANLKQDYKEALVMQKKMRAWTANCRTYHKKLIKERKALVAQIISEGHSLKRIGLDRWRYWFMGSFDKLGREEIVFHLPLEDFVMCKGSAKEYSRSRLEEYGEGYDTDDSEAELDDGTSFLDQGLVPIVAYEDEIKFDNDSETYSLVPEDEEAPRKKKTRLSVV